MFIPNQTVTLKLIICSFPDVPDSKTEFIASLGAVMGKALLGTDSIDLNNPEAAKYLESQTKKSRVQLLNITNDTDKLNEIIFQDSCLKKYISDVIYQTSSAPIFTSNRKVSFKVNPDYLPLTHTNQPINARVVLELGDCFLIINS